MAEEIQKILNLSVGGFRLEKLLEAVLAALVCLLVIRLLLRLLDRMLQRSHLNPRWGPTSAGA